MTLRRSLLARDKVDLEKKLSHYSRLNYAEILDHRFEQYPTSTSIAAHVTWTAYMKNSVRDMTIMDLGCGIGILSTAVLLLGARRVICVDIDERILSHAIEVTYTYYSELNWRMVFIEGDATEIELSNIDTVIMNPPFGVLRHNRGIDLRFLENALRNSRFTYSLHKYSEGLLGVIEKIHRDRYLEYTWFEILDIDIPMIYRRHRRRVYRFKALFLGLTKRGDMSGDSVTG